MLSADHLPPFFTFLFHTLQLDTSPTSSLEVALIKVTSYFHVA